MPLALKKVFPDLASRNKVGREKTNSMRNARLCAVTCNSSLKRKTTAQYFFFFSWGLKRLLQSSGDRRRKGKIIKGTSLQSMPIEMCYFKRDMWKGGEEAAGRWVTNQQRTDF